MVRPAVHRPSRRPCFPHGCGDGPLSPLYSCPFAQFSPRVWGWSGLAQNGLSIVQVFPTGVGMVRSSLRRAWASIRFPHGCGDGPIVAVMEETEYQFSPRVWGWSGGRVLVQPRPHVFPTGVGMVRLPAPPLPPCGGFPHGCGDGPNPLPATGSSVGFSPRVWGWSCSAAMYSGVPAVFPTGVGMVREKRHVARGSNGFPHGCGDGPPSAYVYPTHVVFSPRVWGWSALPADSRRTPGVFPTGVGMVRSPRCTPSPSRSFPHGCGDGPEYTGLWYKRFMFSPRVWGWSDRDRQAEPGQPVFPTGVGMVR